MECIVANSILIFYMTRTLPLSLLVSTEPDAGSLKHCFSNFSDSLGLPHAGELVVKMLVLIQAQAQALIVSISDKLPSNADASGPRTTL